MKDLLLEIGCEEIPASYIDPALAWLNEAAKKEFAQARLSFGEVVTEGTPRRLVLIVRGLDEAQPDLSHEVLGPRAEAAFDADGKLTPQAQGFLSAKKIDPAKAYRKQTPKGEVLAAQMFEAGKSTKLLLADILPKLIREMPFPKTMRWEASGALFARPVRWIVALFGNEVVDFSFADVQSSVRTTGHRFLSPEWVKVASADEYLQQMQKKFVMLSVSQRRELIKSQAGKLAKEQGGKLVSDEALLDIVKNLVEYPWPLVGEFETRYLDIPKEILICEMREHQKYFAVSDESGNLLARFIVVAGSKPADEKAVAFGHGRVLRARFEDGAFYYFEDLKTPLVDFVARLARVQFQRELGSVLDKTKRIEALSGKLAAKLGLEASQAIRAAQLCKADLVSGVVAQFPELQGVMGRYYAEKAGENKEVAKAIGEHYWPRFAGDAIPTTQIGCIVSLADKLDTLVGVIGIGKAPKGNTDPFGLRRAAIAIARIIVEQGFRLSLSDLVKMSLQSYGSLLKTPNHDEVLNFMLGRARGIFTAPTTLLDGAIAAGSDDLADLSARIEALFSLQQKDPQMFAQLAAAFKRAGNIVSKAIADKSYDAESAPDFSLLQHPSERGLAAEIDKTRTQIEALGASQSQDDLQGRYVEVMKEIAGLKPHVDRFFDDVMVMTDDAALRTARLALLYRLQSAANVIADFTRIQL